MFDDFFVRALVAGIGIALVAGPLGCFVVWRRLSYFGDTLAHSAVLGVSLAIFFEINIMLSVFLIAVLISLVVFAKKGWVSIGCAFGINVSFCARVRACSNCLHDLGQD
jgi:zinc transport system permease protein